MKTYAVFDTNVLVSAMITHNPDAPTVKVIEAMALKKIVPLYNEEIVGEYDNVLHRDKFNLLDEDVANMISFLLSPASRMITGLTLPVDGGLTTS